MIVAAGLLATSAITSCKKEVKSNNPSTPNNTTNVRQPGEVEISSLNFYDKNMNPLDSNDINANLDYLIAITPINDTVANAIYFESEDDAYNHIVANNIMPELKNRIEIVRILRNIVTAENIDVNSDTHSSQVLQNYIDSISGTNALLKVTALGAFYEHYVFPGTPYGSTSAIVPAPRWTLGSFNNKASAARVSLGSCTVFDNRWWRGKAIFMFGTAETLFGFTPQSATGWDFNDRVESYL